MRRGESRLELKNLLEVLCGLGGLALRQIRSGPEEAPLQTRRVFPQDGLNGPEALVMSAFIEGDFGQPSPRREIVRGLLSRLHEDPPGLLTLARQEIDVGESDPFSRSGRLKISGDLELSLGLRQVTPRRIELSES